MGDGTAPAGIRMTFRTAQGDEFECIWMVSLASKSGDRRDIHLSIRLVIIGYE